jgi:predicted TIM-barrel fold metal-dependent hydrolase
MATIVSADSHVMEPGDLWQERLDRKYRDNSPRVAQGDKGALQFQAPGVRPFPVALGFGIGLNGQQLHDHMANFKGYEESGRRSGWDPIERLKDQDVDGVYAEVMYTTLGMPLFGLPDLELQLACFRVYNDYVKQYCSAAPKRLYGVALTSLVDINEGVKELKRCAAMGFRAAQIWGVSPVDKPYYLEEYEPYWAAAQEHGMAISLHVATGKNQAPVTGGPQMKLGSAQQLMTRMDTIHGIQVTLLNFIYGGVFDRFPGLQVVSAEHDAGWVPHFVHRIDRQYEKWASSNDKKLKLKPSDYMRRNVHVTFQDDPVAGIAAKFYGEDNFMWGSDFPHSDATWPHSREAIDRSMEGVPQYIRRKITCMNAARLYGMDLN